ncbi:hypothetical protein Enr10x_32080 [Gimesia panareensis]|uniref:Uncharacterized protein n=1 Tax=Gimesia panareensis TaxID=2527978 RepID=A0A517Q8C3_9PLAN|nr:hypothetical protein [Gimesia panareensis]QDT27873.1 hypothetical protein Enr10x_32080 [Gimesia panareensis]
MTRLLLTTATFLFASQSLIAFAESDLIYNARSLIDREWACSYKITHTDYNRSTLADNDHSTRRRTTRYGASQPSNYISTVSTILSLKPGEKWDEGKAWILKATENDGNTNRTTYQSWKGYYQFLGDPDDDENLVLRLGFTRQYSGKKRLSGITWSLDTRYEKKGADIFIPLDGRTVPQNRITLSVVEGFFVDSQGEPTIVRHEPYGFLQKLSGVGDIKTVYSTGFIGLGDTVVMRDVLVEELLKSTGLLNSLPTGCKLHLSE